jgi:hypothetical protein
MSRSAAPSRSHPRGGAPVGYLAELEPVEAGAVTYLRMWFDGAEAREQVRRDLASALGADRGEAAAQRVETMFELCVQYARRPLMRHGVQCKCLGADESCFANFIGYASDGAREDAFLMAANIVRPDMAASLVGLAEEFGLALKAMRDRVPVANTRFETIKPYNTHLH